MDNLDEKLKKIDKELTDLRIKVKDSKKNFETTIHDFTKEIKANDKVKNSISKLIFNVKSTITCPKTNEIEAGSLNYSSIFWASDNNAFSNQIVATTNKGECYVYNTSNNRMVYGFKFTKSEINTCAMELSENSLIAAGGYDGGIYVCNINANNPENSKKKNENDFKKFSGHQGVVSCVRFLNNNFLMSASYDSVILLWDINSQGKFLNSYHDHNSEVSGLDVNELNGNIFATGSGDTTVKLWDIREKKSCVCTFKGSDSSVNCVKFLPGRLSTLAAGSEDSVIRLYDLRALKELASYKKKEGYNSINSIGFSKSGQFLFSTSNNCDYIYFWDLFSVDGLPINNLYKHKSNGNKGFKQAAINSAGDTIAAVIDDQIIFLK